MILELLLDALLDSVKMLPFLFAAYWLIEYVEHRHSEGIEKALAGGGPGLQPVCIAKSKSPPPCGEVLFCAVRARDRERPCAIQFPPIAE